jgi:flagellar basal body P-ring formation protein FlgA
VLLAALACAGAAQADEVDAPLAQQVRELALNGARTGLPAAEGTGPRVEVSIGNLDPRLHLAPCQHIEPHLPAGARLWGKTRIGLRCTQGPVAWNVYLPVTVKVFAPSLVAASNLPAGTTLGEADLREAEVDLAAESGTAVAKSTLAVGRVLARPLSAGQALRQTDLKSRQWFAAGDMVSVVAVGQGYSVAGEGQALTPGVEGQAVRVRTENGRVISGQAVAERRVEIPL